MKLLWSDKVPQEWTEYLIEAIKKYGKDLLESTPNDYKEYNPKYPDMDKVYFWSQLIVAMAKRESNWKEKTVYVENFRETDKPNSPFVRSTGLLQMSVPSCNQDRYSPEGSRHYTHEDLKDAKLNLEKAVMIINYWVKTDNRVGGYKLGAGRYWSVMRGNKSSTRWIKNQLKSMDIVLEDSMTVVKSKLPIEVIQKLDYISDKLEDLQDDIDLIKNDEYSFDYDCDDCGDDTQDQTPVMQERIPFAVQNIGGYEHKERGSYPNGHPKGVVLHFNAGRGGNAKDEKEAKKYAKRLIKYLSGKGLNTITIDSFGNIYQNSSILKWGYHAGTSSFPGLKGNVSNELLGIDIMSAGKLKEKNGKLYTWFKKEIPRENARYVESKDNVKAGWYEKFTEEQEKALTKLILWLHHNGDGRFSIDFVSSHDETSPDRKNDCGGSLSMTIVEYRNYLKSLI